MKDLITAVKERHSVRSYTDSPIPQDVVSELNKRISHANEAAGLDLQLVCGEPRAFGESRLASYGKFSGVSNYLAVVAPKNKQAEIAAGYWGEDIVLLAQQLGLNTCWVGLTFSKKRVEVRIPDGYKLYALIAIGYGAAPGRTHKIKSPDKVADARSLQVSWFARGVELALLAPTALNQQKFHFSLRAGNLVEASAGWGPYSKIDLGIACRHFEIGAAPEVVQFA